jgi:hypothetical protein
MGEYIIARIVVLGYFTFGTQLQYKLVASSMQLIYIIRGEYPSTYGFRTIQASLSIGNYYIISYWRDYNSIECCARHDPFVYSLSF